MNKVVKLSHVKRKITPEERENRKKLWEIVMKSFQEKNNAYVTAMQSLLLPQKTISWVIQALLPNFSSVYTTMESLKEVTQVIPVIYSWLQEIQQEIPTVEISRWLQKLDNINDFRKNFGESEYYSSGEKNESILNLWPEIQIDTQNECFLNPINNKEFHFSFLPKDMRDMVRNLVSKVPLWCDIDELWEELQSRWKNECKNRKVKGKEKNEFSVFVSNRTKNFKDMIYRKLDVQNKRNFIKSQNKVVNLVIF